MRSSEILILVGAAVVAFLLIKKAQATSTGGTSAASPGLSATSLAYYLDDIYRRLDAGETRDSVYLSDIYGRIGQA